MVILLLIMMCIWVGKSWRNLLKMNKRVDILMKEKTNQKEVAKKASAEALFQEIASVIAENFVAIYQMEQDNVLTMRLPNGQQFQIKVQEILQ